MKITRRQLRRIIREVHGGAKGPFPDRYGTAPKATTPDVWADQNGLQLELDNAGQKIIYLDNEQADRLDMPVGVRWDAIKNPGGDGWVIYTGEYDKKGPDHWTDDGGVYRGG